MDFIDFFCGIGTIRMGFEQAGHRCVYSVEWDKHKRRVYSAIFGKEPEGRDIRECRGTQLPRADCWCFGAPCQDFSIAGERKGLEGDRSSLVREVFRLVRETPKKYRPRYLLYENVKGMLSSNKGFDFLEILFKMDSLGYDTEWQMLNSKNYGVPHNRERVYTAGHLRGTSSGKIFPITGTDKPIGVPIKRIAHANKFRRYFQTYDPYSSIEALDTCQGGGRQPCVIIDKQGRVKWKNTQGQYASCLTVAGHSGGNHSDMDLLVQTKQDIHGILITQKKIAKETDIANTLTARNPSTSRGNNTPITAIRNGTRIRRLTPKECWRLQGIQDEITNKVIAAGISDTQMYRGAGDACTVNVIYEIAKRLS